MLAKRVQEIIDSPRIIAVHYKEDPVWLNSVNTANNMANVNLMGYTETDNMEIPVSELYETNVKD
jgi:H-type small acid-soluble spore protein